MTVDTCGRIRVTDGVHLLCSILDEREERRTVRLERLQVVAASVCSSFQCENATDRLERVKERRELVVSSGKGVFTPARLQEARSLQNFTRPTRETHTGTGFHLSSSLLKRFLGSFS